MNSSAAGRPRKSLSRRTHALFRPRSAVLCREWKSRFKGRDWYDLVWFAAHHPELHLSHLEQRMRQTGHWAGPAPLKEADLRGLLAQRIDSVDIVQIRREVEPFVKDPGVLSLWSKGFFLDVTSRIKAV